MLTSLVSLDLSIEGQVPPGFTALWSLELEVLDLGGNRLYGVLHPALFRNLTSLHFLDLSRNRFAESEQLEVLDLSMNSLTGVVPPRFGLKFQKPTTLDLTAICWAICKTRNMILPPFVIYCTAKMYWPQVVGTTTKTNGGVCFEKKILKPPVQMLYTVCAFMNYWVGLYTGESQKVLKEGVNLMMRTTIQLLGQGAYCSCSGYKGEW
jgi:hypothetical protein